MYESKTPGYKRLIIESTAISSRSSIYNICQMNKINSITVLFIVIAVINLCAGDETENPFRLRQKPTEISERLNPTKSSLGSVDSEDDTARLDSDCCGLVSRQLNALLQIKYSNQANITVSHWSTLLRWLLLSSILLRYGWSWNNREPLYNHTFACIKTTIEPQSLKPHIAQLN